MSDTTFYKRKLEQTKRKIALLLKKEKYYGSKLSTYRKKQIEQNTKDKGED